MEDEIIIEQLLEYIIEERSPDPEVIVENIGPPGPEGDQGPSGDSAYQTWLDLGNTGTEQEFIDSLTGPQGPEGPPGPPGTDGVVSFNTRTGEVTSEAGDYDTDMVSEGSTNFYFTPDRLFETILTGYTVPGSAAVIDDTYTVLGALEQLDANIQNRNLAQTLNAGNDTGNNDIVGPAGINRLAVRDDYLGFFMETEDNQHFFFDPLDNSLNAESESYAQIVRSTYSVLSPDIFIGDGFGSNGFSMNSGFVGFATGFYMTGYDVSTSQFSSNGDTATFQYDTRISLDTPNITFSQYANGLLKTSHGTGAVALAVAGTDYQAPISLSTIGVNGTASLLSNILNIPNYTVFGTKDRITVAADSNVINIALNYAGQASIDTVGALSSGSLALGFTAIANTRLANSSTTINGTTISLGASGTVTAAAGTLTGTTLNATVVNSSLTSLGTVVTGTWSASTIAINKGGSGQTTANAAFNAFAPSQTGNSGKFLTTNGTDTSWATISGTGTVTSVDVAGGTTGLTTSGGPITTSGTITLAGILVGANGGSGVNNGASTITIGGSLTFSGAFTTAITVTAGTTVTLPITGTLYGTRTGSISSAQLAVSLSDETGTGVAVFNNSPTLISPVLGAATATSLNGLTVTTTTGTLTMSTFTLTAVASGNVLIGSPGAAGRVMVASSSTVADGSGSLTYTSNALISSITTNGIVKIQVTNGSASGAAEAQLVSSNGSTTAILRVLSSAWTNAGQDFQDLAQLITNSSIGFTFESLTANTYWQWLIGGNALTNQALRLDASGLTVGVAGTTMGKVLLAGSTSGALTLTTVAAAGSAIVTFAAVTGTVVLGTGTTNTFPAFSATNVLANSALTQANNSITWAGTRNGLSGFTAQNNSATAAAVSSIASKAATLQIAMNIYGASFTTAGLLVGNLSSIESTSTIGLLHNVGSGGQYWWNINSTTNYTMNLTSSVLTLQANAAGVMKTLVLQSDATGTSQAQHQVSNGTSAVTVSILGTGFTTSGLNVADVAKFVTTSSVGVVFQSNTAATTFWWTIGGNAATNQAMMLTSTGLTIGVAGTTNGQINFSGSTSGATALKASAVAGSAVITLPALTGTVALTNQLPISGSFSQVGAATTTFTVTIGATQANNTYRVNVTPTAVLSAAAFYVTNKTTTTFDVVYVAGLTGTVTFDWSLFVQ